MKEWFEGKTVAIVGNAMSLFDKEYGDEIDSHDVIVRLNRAAMLYDREDVRKVQSEITHGKKTNVWMFWNVSEYQNYIKTIDPSIKKMHMHIGFKVEGRTDIDYVYPKPMYKELTKSAKYNKSPSTGFMALDYISKCNPTKVYVYGFDWKETPTFTDPTRKKDAGMHNFALEKEYCQKTYFNTDRFILRK
jgi:hypothetical protein